MKVNYQRSYKKTSTKTHSVITMFVYGVSGTPEELESFKTAQGEFYREDDDQKPIWFSSKFVGKQSKLLVTSNGKIVADTSEFDQAASLVSQYGGNLGNAMANAFASQLIGHPVESTATVNATVDSTDKLD